MKNYVKSILFVTIFIFLSIILTIFLAPFDKEHSLYELASYDILEEPRNTIDAIVLGDSLIYSSINPMQIWNDFGFTVYDCAEPAYFIKEAYKYLKVAIETQQPKVVIMEANMLFRDEKNYPWYDIQLKKASKLIPIYKFHNNWKSLLVNKDANNSNKGYKLIKKVESSTNYDYMKYSEDIREFPGNNLKHFKKIVELCKKNKIKFLLISTPSQISANYPRRNASEKIANELGLEYIDLNLDNPLNIDWTRETKDKGGHLNYWGARKVSQFIGDYLKNTRLLSDKREDDLYQSWHEAYKIFKNSIN